MVLVERSQECYRDRHQATDQAQGRDCACQSADYLDGDVPVGVGLGRVEDEPANHCHNEEP